jgi:hypothetical protein
MKNMVNVLRSQIVQRLKYLSGYMFMWLFVQNSFPPSVGNNFLLHDSAGCCVFMKSHILPRMMKGKWASTKLCQTHFYHEGLWTWTQKEI